MKINLLIITMVLALSSKSVMAQLPSYVPTNGLVGYWPFNGNANDESGNGNNGTNNGATLTSDRFGNINSSYNFDGLNDLIRIPHQNALNLIGDYSISVWYKGNYQNIFNNNWVFIAKRDDNGICCSPNVPYDVFIPFNNTNFGVPVMAYANGNYSFSAPSNATPISLDQWQNLTITNTSDLIKFYINGQLIFSQNISSTLRATNTADLLIGSVNREIGAEWMNGKLDDIGIWNRALTQEEIMGLFNAQSNTCETLVINSGPLSFNPPTYASTITIYPNPANDQITIDCGNLANVSGWSIKIVNAIGQEVFTGPMNTQQYVVPLNSWSGQGLYFVKIYDASNNLVNTKKIILQ